MTTDNQTINKKSASTDYNEAIAAIYSGRNNRDTGYLAYRDLPLLLKNLGVGLKALDFGCGTGFSSNILAEAGHHVTGADISTNMLSQAQTKYPSINFVKINEEKTPFQDAEFDIILSTFVLLEIDCINKIKETLIELRRIIKDNGHLIIVTTSEYFPKHNWLTGLNNIEKNANIISGQSYSVFDTKNNMTFSDFYYCDQSYRSAFTKAGFEVKKLLQPLGEVADEIEWSTELTIPPYSIYICTPSA
jgi:ubiquinone/menaquinone biosynthesis C-methylase UbiE